MKFSKYEKEAMETCLPSADNMDYAISLIASEAGELAGHWSKAIRDDDKQLSEERAILMVKELGDILWGVALACKQLEISMGDVANVNLEKLRSRQNRGVIGGYGDNR